jgi:hypothetical protein
MIFDAGGFDFGCDFVFRQGRRFIPCANFAQDTGEVLCPVAIERLAQLLPLVGIQHLDGANQLIEIAPNVCLECPLRFGFSGEFGIQ